MFLSVQQLLIFKINILFYIPSSVFHNRLPYGNVLLLAAHIFDPSISGTILIFWIDLCISCGAHIQRWVT